MSSTPASGVPACTLSAAASRMSLRSPGVMMSAPGRIARSALGTVAAQIADVAHAPRRAPRRRAAIRALSAGATSQHARRRQVHAARHDGDRPQLLRCRAPTRCAASVSANGATPSQSAQPPWVWPMVSVSACCAAGADAHAVQDAPDLPPLGQRAVPAGRDGHARSATSVGILAARRRHQHQLGVERLQHQRVHAASRAPCPPRGSCPRRSARRRPSPALPRDLDDVLHQRLVVAGREQFLRAAARGTDRRRRQWAPSAISVAESFGFAVRDRA